MEWRKIRDLPYECSDTGQVKSSRTGRILKPDIASGDYLRVTFSVNGKTSREFVNRIVCEVFKGEPPSNEHVARHLDGNSLNNSAGNLAWGTRSENEQDKRRHGTYQARENNPLALLTEALVSDIRRRYSENKKARQEAGFQQVEHGFVMKLAAEIGVSVSCIKSVVQHISWKSQNAVD